MLIITTDKRVRELVKKVEEDAFTRAYELGYMMCMSEHFNKRGFIAPRLDIELGQILKDEGV